MTDRTRFDVKTVGVTGDRIDLSWMPVPEAMAYRLYRAESPAVPVACDAQWAAETCSTRHADRELAPATAYRYRVAALDATGREIAVGEAAALTRKAGLFASRSGAFLSIHGDAFEVSFDSGRGGEIAEIRQYDGDSWFRVNAEAGTAPGFTLTDETGRDWPVSTEKVELRMEKETPEEVRFSLVVTVAGIRIGMTYSVFREGVLFCDLRMPEAPFTGATQGVPAEASQAALDRVSGRLALQLHPELLAGKFAWGHFHREYGPARVWKRPDERVIDANRMMPIAMADFGRSAEGGFTNHIEFFIEDSPAEGAGSWFGDDGQGGFKFAWTFRGRAMRNLYFLPWDMGYLHTRWGLCLGAARQGPCGRALPARRNNLTGARIFHASAGQGVPKEMREHWPFNVPPVDLIETPYEGLPTDAEIEQARRQGADVIVVHQSWMRSGGSNCEPPADYIPRDAADLQRFADICHRLGIRVGLYMRGTEKHALFQPYFERFLRRDCDGLYVDWSSPYCMGHQGCSDLHFSAYNYFLFTRALRERVGERGFLIAHSGMVPTMIAFAVFDAYLPGEWRTQKEGFFNSPDEALYHGFASCVGTNPIWASAAFRTPRAVAFYAGLGFAQHVGMARRKDCRPYFPMEGLWRIWSSIPMDRAICHNNRSENFRPIRASRPEFLSCLYKVDRDLLLIVVSNLGPKSDATLTLDMPALGLTGRYAVTELSGAAPQQFRTRELAALSDGTLRLDPFDTDEYRGYRLVRQQPS